MAGQAGSRAKRCRPYSAVEIVVTFEAFAWRGIVTPGPCRRSHQASGLRRQWRSRSASPVLPRAVDRTPPGSCSTISIRARDTDCTSEVPSVAAPKRMLTKRAA